MCFGEMALLAGVERNATVSVPANQSAVVLEATRPALRLLRKLQTFGNILDETYRTHGIGRVLEDLTLDHRQTFKWTTRREETLRCTARYMVYGKNHELCKEGEPIDRLILTQVRLGATFARCSISRSVTGSCARS